MIIKRKLSNKDLLEEGTQIEFDVNTLNELLNLPWMKEIVNSGAKYHLSKSSMNHNPDYLMALLNINGEVKYHVIGYIYGKGTNLGLKYFN
jgi:hypothetical protein